MMSSRPMKSSESDSVHCIQCTDEKSNPRLLQCFHSFCLQCLESLDHNNSNSTSGLILCCPICSEQTLVSGTLDDELPQSNIFGKRILDINKITRRRGGATSMQEPCAGCLGNDDECSAIYSHDVDSYCLDCQEFYCGACAGNHTNFRFAASHRLITGNDVRKPRDLVGGTTSRFCSVHVGETEVLYCRKCDECICEICYSENHERCEEVEVVDDMKQEMEESLMRMIEGLRRRIDLGKEFLRRLDREERQMIRRVNEVEDELDVRSSMTKELVLRSVEGLHHQLESHARQRSEICGSVRRAGNRQVDDMEILHTTMTRCVEKASLAHIVSINSGGRLRKVEKEATDFSESWQTMMLTFDESMELEDLFGNDSLIGEVLGRLEETDSDYGYLDDDDDDDDDVENNNNSGPEFDVEYGASKDQVNEKLETNATTVTEVNGDVEVDNGEVRIDTGETKDEENFEVVENKEEFTNTEAAFRSDDVDIEVDKSDNYRGKTEKEEEEKEEEKKEEKEEEEEKDKKEEEKEEKEKETKEEENEKEEQVEEENEKEKEEKEEEEEDKKEKEEEREISDNRTTETKNEIREKTREKTEAVIDQMILKELNRVEVGTAAQKTNLNERISKKMRGNCKGNSKLFTLIPGEEDADDECDRTMNNSSHHQQTIDLRVINKDEAARVDDTVDISCITPDNRMNQNRTDQWTTMLSRFSTSDPPIIMRQTGSEQDSIRTPFPVTSGHPITTRLNVSQPPDTGNFPITMRPNGAEQDLRKTPFPPGRIQDWSKPEIVQPEVLFCHEADTYRGAERVESGLIKILISKLDNNNTNNVSEIYFEWNEEVEQLTSDFRLEHLNLNKETHAIQMMSLNGREASAVEFRTGEEAEEFENTLDDLIGQMGSLRITSKAM